MRTIEWSSSFKTDYKREKKGKHAAKMDFMFIAAVEFLAYDVPMLPSYLDHQLTGDMKDFRDCHLLPDFLLIYQRRGPDVLYLLRLGSHSQIF